MKLFCAFQFIFGVFTFTPPSLNKADTWYAPSLAAEMEAEGIEFSKMRTAQRRAQRKATATYHARDWHDRGEEEGEHSEGGASAASSTGKIRKAMGGSRFDIR